MQATRLLAPIPAVLLAACSGGGGGGDAAASGSTDALITTSPSTELFALEAELESLVLLREDGSAGGDLVEGAVEAELAALEDASLWAAEGAVAEGTYVAARATFAAGSLAAKAADGSPLDVEAEELTLEEPLVEPLAIADGGYARVEVYLDLLASLTFSSLDPGAATFAPVGGFRPIGGGESPALRPFFGIVLEASLADETLAVEVYRDPELEHPLRVVDVELAPDATLVDLNDVVFPGVADFYATLVLGQTVVEVEGELLGTSGVLASKVEILSHHGGADPKVVISGKVLHVDEDAQELVLLIQHVDEGAALAGPVLEGLGDPSAIDVAWDEHTVFFDDDGEPEGEPDLEVGEMVQVEFADFSMPPFPAAKIETVEEPALSGVIHDVAGLPGSFELEVGGGDVVTIDLDEDTELCLDVQFQPAIQLGELAVGMKAVVKGGDDDDGEEPEEGFDADKVKLHHGHLVNAIVAAADEATATLWVDGGHVAQTFGELAPPGPMAVVIQPGCLFGQQVDSAPDVFDLVAAGEEVVVQVKGTGSSVPGEVHAYDLKAKTTP